MITGEDTASAYAMTLAPGRAAGRRDTLVPSGKARPGMGANGSDDATDRFATFQQLLVDNETLHEFLTGLAREAAADVDGALSCGVTVRRGARQPITFGSSDTFAAPLDEVQYAADDGPCLQALRTGVTVEVNDANTEDRWAAYITRGVAEGVRASLSMPITAAGETLGALNLYARAPRALTEADRASGARFADQAAGAPPQPPPEPD